MMKKLLTLTIGISFTLTMNAQRTERYLSSRIISGCPKEIETIANESGLSNLTYSNLETGIDSIKVVFGTLTQGKSNGYWISSYINGKLTTFRDIKLLKKGPSQFPTNVVDIIYDNSSKKISVELTHNTSTNEIEYLWVNDNQKNKKAQVINIEKAIQKGKLFPNITIESLQGENISVKDFIGKYVVINWWATTCSPCIQEIPGLNSLVEKYKSNPEVLFLSIAFDKKEKVQNFLKSKNFN